MLIQSIKILILQSNDTTDQKLDQIQTEFARISWDDNGNSKDPFYCVKIRSTECQVFKTRILYDGQELIRTSPVDIICMSVDEESCVKENASYSFLWWSKPLAYETQLVAIGSELQTSRDILYARVYPRNMFISRLKWDLYYENEYTFQTSRRTKVGFHF